jgi:NAD(P)H-flavin reductase
MVPRPFLVAEARRDTRDTVTLFLRSRGGEPLEFRPGQFTMLTAFGVGEVPISVSGDPRDPEVLQHTIRDVGSVSHALAESVPGTVLGVRGPFGHGWEVGDARGGDLVIAAGGIGLAPLRPAVLEVCADRSAYERVTLLYGARSPEEMLFVEELREWADRFALEVHVTVDAARYAWRGRIGLITQLIDLARFDPGRTTVLTCGPEVMMRHTARGFVDRGVPASAIRLSMERNMQCGIGLCGHCQLRELFVCADGPVFGYDRLEALLSRAEV